MTVRGSNEEPTVTGHRHYFSETPDSPSRPMTVTMDVGDTELTLRTDRGVFSPTRLDPGTRSLLDELPGLDHGPVVDLGCGYGPIACALAAANPELEVMAVDPNERARSLCERNAHDHGLSVSVMAPGDVTDDLVVAAIVSNPPIRIGKVELHRLLGEWLDRLEPGGTAYLVVHKNLGADPLARWLAERGTVTRLRSKKGYRVLRVDVPDRADTSS